MLVFRYIDLDDTAGDLGVDIHVVQGFQGPGGGNGLPQIPPLHGIGPGGRHGLLGLFDLVVLVAAGPAGNQDCQDYQQHFMLLHDVHAVFPPSSSCSCRKKSTDVQRMALHTSVPSFSYGYCYCIKDL